MRITKKGSANRASCSQSTIDAPVPSVTSSSPALIGYSGRAERGATLKRITCSTLTVSTIGTSRYQPNHGTEASSATPTTGSIALLISRVR